MPPAARITDMHVCPMVTVLVPHVGGPILPPCEPTVLIGGLPAARITDMLTCVGPPDIIVMGSPTVLIGGLMAARIGDPTAHGGVIVLGCFTVMIGEAGTPSPVTPSAPMAPSAPAVSVPSAPAAPEPPLTQLKQDIENDLQKLRDTQQQTGVPDKAGRESLKNKVMQAVEKLDVKSPTDKSVFYSGKGMRKAAEALSKDKGLVTVESLPDGKWLDKLGLFNEDALGPKNAHEVWGRMSERYAEGASGEVKVVLNNPRAGSIFNTRELPALVKNAKVTKIVLAPAGGAGPP